MRWLSWLQDAQRSVSVFDGQYNELQKKEDTLRKEDSKLRNERVCDIPYTYILTLWVSGSDPTPPKMYFASILTVFLQ